VTEGLPPRRGANPAATARAEAPGGPALRSAGPAMAAAVSVIGVGPGAGPAARLSPIATGPGRPTSPRAVPPQPPRPMHPPIARVMPSPVAGSTALQAYAAGARGGPGTPAARPATVAGAAGGAPALRATGGARLGFGMPSLRRNVCPHFFMSGARGAIPIQAPHLLKALVRQEANLSRCQLRGGVHLEQGYVNDVCLSARFNQCVFYEDELSR